MNIRWDKPRLRGRIGRGALSAFMGVCCAACLPASETGATTDPANPGSSGGMPPVNLGDLPPLFNVTTTVFPLAGEASACVDTNLRLSFQTPVGLGSGGLIQVFQSDQLATPVAMIDVAATMFMTQIAGRVFRTQHPVFIEGSEVVISLGSELFQPGTTYYVTVDPGVFADAAGAPLGGVAGPSDWSFTTRIPATPSSEMVVARDGTGDFCSVQGAINATPLTNATPFVVNIHNGTYREIVYIPGKQNLTLRGEDRTNTVIAYPNNETLQQGGGSRARAMIEAANTTDLVIENLTLHNTTPQCGSQAEALFIDGGQRVILRNLNVLSRQDTLLLTGTVYVRDCYVEGNVDYIWGDGTAYFENCEIKTITRAGYTVQSRNGGATFGFVFVDSTFSSDPGLVGHYLGRIEADRFPDSHVAYVDCRFGEHILPAGWLVTGAPAELTSLRFWEYQSTTLDGTPVDVSARHALSRQLTADEASTMRDKPAVLRGWDPEQPAPE